MTRILVIDSDNDMAENLRLSLQPEVYEVIVAHSPEQALECTRASNPNVILLDLASDNHGSQYICKALRAITQAPILVLSPLNTPGFMAQLLNEGADDCLVKPSPNSVLIARLKTLARRARAELEASDSPRATVKRPSLSKNGGK